MSLENMVRGSGDIGATFATAWGVRQLQNSIVHIQNIKPRDFDPCGPFQLAARPYLEQLGNFHLFKAPNECGTLAEEQGMHGDVTNDQKRDERIRREAITAAWLTEDPNLTSPEMVARFKSLGIEIDDSTVRRYRIHARKGHSL
jgi:hypothetical protein